MSGAAGLVYEVTWSRRLELTFGSTGLEGGDGYGGTGTVFGNCCGPMPAVSEGKPQ